MWYWEQSTHGCISLHTDLVLTHRQNSGIFNLEFRAAPPNFEEIPCHQQSYITGNNWPKVQRCTKENPMWSKLGKPFLLLAIIPHKKVLISFFISNVSFSCYTDLNSYQTGARGTYCSYTNQDWLTDTAMSQLPLRQTSSWYRLQQEEADRPDQRMLSANLPSIQGDDGLHSERSQLIFPPGSILSH